MTLAGETATATVERVTVALADLLLSACDVAVTSTETAGGTAGAVYRPVASIVPSVLLPPGV